MSNPTSRPLEHVRVLVTRASRQARSLSELFQQQGATVVTLPAIEIVAAEPEPIDNALRRLSTYDWLVFTSANGVSAVTERMAVLGIDPATVSSVRVAAIGSATAACLRDSGLRVDFIPQRFVAEAFVEELSATGVVRNRILLPQAEIARDTVATGLRQAGAEVDVVVAYRTVLPSDRDMDYIQKTIADVDIVTFASPSSVRNMMSMTRDRLPNARIVCVGPITAAAAEDAGLTVAAVADEYSMAGMVEAVVRLVDGDH